MHELYSIKLNTILHKKWHHTNIEISLQAFGVFRITFILVSKYQGVPRSITLYVPENMFNSITMITMFIIYGLVWKEICLTLYVGKHLCFTLACKTKRNASKISFIPRTHASILGNLIPVASDIKTTQVHFWSQFHFYKWRIQ